MQENGILTNPIDIHRKTREESAKRLRYNNWKEYRQNWTERIGREHLRKRLRRWRHTNGIQLPIPANEDCSGYIGIFIGERIAKIILAEIFEYIEKVMPPNHPWYDFVVRGGYKVNVKTSTMTKELNCFNFNIRYNNITDYFLLLAFNDREKLELVHVLLIGKNDMIRKNGCTLKKFYEREGIKIYNNFDSSLSFNYFQKYEWINKLKCLKEIQEILREEY